MRGIIERLETIGLGDRIWIAAVTVTCSRADAGYGALSPRSLRWWVAVWNRAVRPPPSRSPKLSETGLSEVAFPGSPRLSCLVASTAALSFISLISGGNGSFRQHIAHRPRLGGSIRWLVFYDHRPEMKRALAERKRHASLAAKIFRRPCYAVQEPDVGIVAMARKSTPSKSNFAAYHQATAVKITRSNLDAGMGKYLPPLIFQCGGRSHAENHRQMEG